MLTIPLSSTVVRTGQAQPEMHVSSSFMHLVGCRQDVGMAGQFSE